MGKNVEKNFNEFEEKYSSSWICVLKNVQELRKAIFSNKTKQIQFWFDGTWTSYYYFNESSKKEESSLTLMKSDFQPIDKKSLKSVPFSICELVFGLDYSSGGVSEYAHDRKKSDLKSFLKRDLYLKYYHSYHFDFEYNHLKFHCLIEWEKSLNCLRIKFDKDTIGIAAGLSYIINYLFDLSNELYGDYNAYSLFCKEIRKFEEYYCKTLYFSISQTTTPIEVGLFYEDKHYIDEEKTCFISNNLIKINKLINHFNLDIPLNNAKDGEKCISFDLLYETYHDLYGYMDIDAIKWAIIEFLDIADNEITKVSEKTIDYIPTNSYDFMVQNNEFDINFRIEWKSTYYYFRVKDNLTNVQMNFNSIQSLIYYFDDLSEKILDYKSRIDFYSKIVVIGNKLFEETQNYEVFNYILSRIENMERVINIKSLYKIG